MSVSAFRWQTLGTVNQPCSPLERSGLVGMQPSLTGACQDGQSWELLAFPYSGPSLCTAAVASGSERCQLPGPGFPITRTCTPHPRPGQMAPWLLCRAQGNLDGATWGGQWQGPPHWAPAGATWVLACSLPTSAAERRLPSRGSTRELLCL